MSVHGRDISVHSARYAHFTHPERVRADGSIESELYFVLALFGVELAINCGGPELDDYERWLADHRGASPLYWGKNDAKSGG